jgi:IclR family pca regulon transcriptional regulator
MTTKPQRIRVANAEPDTTVEAPAVDPRLFVASIEKGTRILELFETAPRDLSLTDIVAMTDLGSSATQRFVYSLHQLGYLARDPETRRYSLGPKVLRLYRGYVGARSIMQRAHGVLADLAQNTREAVAWVELLETEIVVIESIASPHVTSVTLAPGMRFEALSASSGQMLLSHAGPAVVAQALQAASAQSRQRAGIKDAAGLARLLAQIRSQGFAMTEKAFDQESLSISAPVFDVHGRAVGAVNLSTLRLRFDREQARAQLVPAVIAAARACSAPG